MSNTDQNNDEQNSTVTETGSYQVGYKKPPKSGRFVKGQSGNPKGRKKGAKSLKTILEKNARRRIRVRTADGVKSITTLEAIVEQTVQSALKGDARARTSYFNLLREAGLSDELADGVEAQMSKLSEEDQLILEQIRSKQSTANSSSDEQDDAT